MKLSPEESRQVRAQLDSLEQLQLNPAFCEFILENEKLLKMTTTTLLEMTPSNLESFITRERMLGAASELQRISTYFSSLEEDLKTQLNQ